MNPLRIFLFATAGITAAVATYGLLKQHASVEQTPRALQSPVYQPNYQDSRPRYQYREFEQNRQYRDNNGFEGWED